MSTTKRFYSEETYNEERPGINGSGFWGLSDHYRVDSHLLSNGKLVDMGHFEKRDWRAYGEYFFSIHHYRGSTVRLSKILDSEKEYQRTDIEVFSVDELTEENVLNELMGIGLSGKVTSP